MNIEQRCWPRQSPCKGNEKGHRHPVHASPASGCRSVTSCCAPASVGCSATPGGADIPEKSLAVAGCRVFPSMGHGHYSRDAQVENVEEDAVCDHVDDVAEEPAQHQRPHDHLQRGRDGGYGTFQKASGERCEGLRQPHAQQLSQPKNKFPMMSPAWKMSVLEVNL